MSRPVLLAFACFASFLVLLPLSLKKPGLPMQLYGDEANQYLRASSLINDGDMRCDAEDLGRLFSEYPFAQDVALVLMTDDGWLTARFPGPITFPLIAAPFVALQGAGGLVALNALLWVAVLALAYWRLRRFNDDGPTLLYCLGFLLFSGAFVYLFRMQSEVFIMAAVMASLTLGWTGDRTEETPDVRRWGWLSGLALALAVSHQPALVLIGLPILAGLLNHRRRAAAGWLLGFFACLGLIALLSLALTGRAWAADGSQAEQASVPVEVATYRLSSPYELPWQDGVSPAEVDASLHTTVGGRRSLANIVEDAAFLFWGRRTGLLPYFPLLLPLLWVFATASARSRLQWALVAVLCVLAVLQVIFEPTARALHDGQIGNPRAIIVYPAFLFLLRKIPRATILASYALGTLVLSSLLLTPFGAGVPKAPNHPHARNWPFSSLPFEYPTLGRASDFRQVALHGLGSEDSQAWLWVPSDQANDSSDEIWLLGGESVELWLASRAEVQTMVFNLRNLASYNRIELTLGGQTHERVFESVPTNGVSFQLSFQPREPDRIRFDERGAWYYYRLHLDTLRGEKPRWRRRVPTSDYIGAALTFLGSEEFIARDIFAVEWSACAAPPRMAPEEEFLAVIRAHNRSAYPWPNRGPARVRLSYHWRDLDGREILYNGRRTDLANAVGPGEELVSWLDVQAPSQPGRYVLEIDPVFENVAWFSTRNDQGTCRAELEVIDASAPI